MKGFEVMTILHDLWPQIKVVGLSAYENEYSIIRLFRLGAMGYLRKGCDLDEIKTAVHLVNEGHFYYDDPVSRELIHHIQRGRKYPEITDRELEFMRYCCTEMKYKEIAVAMQVSERTVDGYRESLCHKLKLESRAGLIMFALSSGVVSAKQFHIQ